MRTGILVTVIETPGGAAVGGAHSHVSHEYDVRVGRGPRTALVTALALVAVGVVFGLWHLWPHGRPNLPATAAFAAPGVTFPHADVTGVQPACPVADVSSPGQPPDMEVQPSSSCGHIRVRLVGVSGGGGEVMVDVPPEVARSGLRAGDRVQLMRQPPGHGQPALYSYQGIDRHAALFWLALVFAGLVVAVARLRGFMAMVALLFSALMVTKFMLPALLAGEAGVWVAVVGASAIMFVVLYLTHGVSLRTSSALAGTLIGIGVTAAVGEFAIGSSRLTGIADEGGGFLAAFVNNLSLTGLLTCGLIVAGLGVLNDVTITQSSAVWELRAAAPHAPRRHVFQSAMRIGRDHIASTIYTITFAYAGASIVVLLILAIYDRPLLDLMSSEDIAEEIVRTLASGIGLVLAVPITTAIAATMASPQGHRPGGWERSEDDVDPFDRFWRTTS
jgi:uncharacterized membrane protein